MHVWCVSVSEVRVMLQDEPKGWIVQPTLLHVHVHKPRSLATMNMHEEAEERWAIRKRALGTSNYICKQS